MISAGATCLDITPPLGTMIPGLFHDRFAERVHDPLHVRSFVMDQGGEGVAIVVCDLIGVKRDYLDRAKDRITEAIGFGAERILISCTHTHTGAATGDDAYTEFLIDRIVDAVRLAWEDRKPVEVSFGQASEDRVVFNRRYRMTDGSVRTNPGVGNPDVVEPVGPVDPEIGVLCLQEADGQPVGLLANYALHYVGAPDAQRSISADYFGAFSSVIQRMRDDRFVAALANGACGDINNVDVQGGKRPQNDCFQHSERVAGLIAAGAMWAWNEMDFADDVPIDAAIQEISLERKPKPSEADLERVREMEGKEKATMAERAFVRRITKRMADVPDQVQTWVQALRIGDLGIAAVPGELMVELGLDLKARSPFAQTMVIELANDSVGYLPTRKSYDEGGYEPEASLFAPGCGEQITDAAVNLLTELA
ncbi:MAG: neutral/alkaline non-lysosomal ceramidase N-terminal domain-containing protein [bacterium]|nr:neutral/alkaline non-lysosomal ceramidase N-terminal domain-containing protein [bacterium]